MGFERVANAVRLMVTRAKVAASVLGPRTLVQVTRYDTETFNNVEVLMPYGMAGRPRAGADVLLFQVGGIGDHKVVLGGDATGAAPADLADGEAGLSLNAGAQRVILRDGYLEIVDPVAVRIVAPSLTWSPDGVIFYTLATAAHVHPDVQLGSSNSLPAVTGLT